VLGGQAAAHAIHFKTILNIGEGQSSVARNGFLASEKYLFESGTYVVPQYIRSGTAQNA
jgi:hypothetical protein